jgi:hypothetical protein
VFLLKQLLPAVLATVLVSGVFAIIGRLWRASNWADAVALGAGYACGHLVTAGWPALPPGEATQWLPCFAIIVAIIGVLDTLLRPPGWLRAVAWFLCCAGILRLLLASKFQYGWSLLGGTAWVVALAAGMLVLTIFFDRAAQRDASISVPLIVTIVAGGTGLAPGHCSGGQRGPRRPLVQRVLLCGTSASNGAVACGCSHPGSDVGAIRRKWKSAQGFAFAGDARRRSGRTGRLSSF